MRYLVLITFIGGNWQYIIHSFWTTQISSLVVVMLFFQMKRNSSARIESTTFKCNFKTVLIFLSSSPSSSATSPSTAAVSIFRRRWFRPQGLDPLRTARQCSVTEVTLVRALEKVFWVFWHINLRFFKNRQSFH